MKRLLILFIAVLLTVAGAYGQARRDIGGKLAGNRGAVNVGTYLWQGTYYREKI